MHKALYPRDDVNSLYVSRKEGGRGIATIKESIDTLRQWLEDYIEKHGGRLIIVRNNTDDTKTSKLGNNQKTKMGRKTTLWMF